MRSYRTGLCGMGTQIKKRRRSKGCVELCYTWVFLDITPVFSVGRSGTDPDQLLMQTPNDCTWPRGATLVAVQIIGLDLNLLAGVLESILTVGRVAPPHQVSD